MTSTLLFWIKIGIAGISLYTVWTIIRSVRRQKKTIPSSWTEWKKLLPDLAFLGLCVFLFFWIQKNFQQQIDIVEKSKDRVVNSLYFSNLNTNAPDSLAAYKGKVVILNIWATWCPPCRREMPDLEELNTKYKDRAMVLALSDEEASVVRAYRNSKQFQMTTGVFRSHPLLDSLDSRPVSILLDKENRVKDVVVGARGYGFFKDWIEGELKEGKN